jgi:hypothetical protein
MSVMATPTPCYDASQPEIEAPLKLCKRREGAQPGNKNATKHGLRASGLPKGCAYIQGQIVSFRRYVRNELADLSLWQEATLQSACRHETRALLAARWLRLEAGELPIKDRVALLKTISDATDKRDACLKAIGLGKPPSAHEELFAMVPLVQEDPETEPNSRESP